jgi:hypothetical protein
VRNGTVRLSSKCQNECMLNRKESDNATRASIKKEMARPRMAKSVRTAGLNLEAERVSGRARTTLPGSVHRIIAPVHTTQPGKAQITVAGADDRYRVLRIENSLADGDGNEVRLKKGAHVKVTLTVKPKK